MGRPWMRLRPYRLWLSAVALVGGFPLLTNACGDSPTPSQPTVVMTEPASDGTSAPQPPRPQPPADSETAPPAPPPSGGGERILVGAGDIADCSRPGASKTADLLDRLDGAVFTAGDNAYMNGTASEFANCYGPTWGRHRARTRPSPGNHDYGTPDAAGYFGYFGESAGPAGRGYYSYDLGSWHIVSLNTNIAVSAGSEQVSWLKADLASHPSRCSLAYYHHPLFSSGQNGGESRQRDLWRVLHAYGVDVIVSGHDHVYERFSPQDADGRLDAAGGIRQFTVGTGGGQPYGFRTIERNSEVRGSTWGVIRLALRASEYSWEFIPVAGESFQDSGRDVCH